ncbi:MAG: hypothetical protein ABI767_13465 [Rhodanobacter sp.]
MKRFYLTGYEAREDRRVRATETWQSVRENHCTRIDALCARVLMRAVEAKILSRRLILIGFRVRGRMRNAFARRWRRRIVCSAAVIWEKTGVRVKWRLLERKLKFRSFLR